MKTTTRRIVSLILAIVMACSAMGVMALAIDVDSVTKKCDNCREETLFTYLFYDNNINSIVACPKHNGLHDAEEWYTGNYYKCSDCGYVYSFDLVITYICLE